MAFARIARKYFTTVWICRKRKRMKTISAVLIVMLCSLSGGVAQTDQLKSFSAVFDALRSGRTVTTVIRYAHCRLIGDSAGNAPTDVIGGMEISPWEYFAPQAAHNSRAFLSASKNSLISHPQYGVIYNYVKLKAFDNDSVEIIVQYLKPAAFTVIMHETFFGAINAGDTLGGVYFYQDRR